MTPRREVEIIDIDDSFEEIRAQLHQTKRSRLAVRRGSSDEVLGILPVKDFYDALSATGTADVLSLTQEVPVVSDLSNAISVIQAIRKSPVHMVLVFRRIRSFRRRRFIWRHSGSDHGRAPGGADRRAGDRSQTGRILSVFPVGRRSTSSQNS
jgi:hypothetical protein